MSEITVDRREEEFMKQLQVAQDRGIRLHQFIAEVLGLDAGTVRTRITRAAPFFNLVDIEAIETAWYEVFPYWSNPAVKKAPQ